MATKSIGLAPQAFISRLNPKELPRTVVIVGKEAYFRDKVRKALLKAIFPEEADKEQGLTIFSEKIDMDRLRIEVNSYPFFGEHSAILITDKELFAQKNEESREKGNQLLEILKDVPEYCTLILQVEALDGRLKLTKALQKEPYYVGCEPIRVDALRPWLVTEAGKYGAGLDQGAVQCIMEYLMSVDTVPLQLLAGEIAKLSLYAGQRTTWTAADVEATFAALPEAGPYALSNAVAQHNLLLALELLAQEKKKNTGIPMLIGSLTATLRRLIAVKEFQRQGYSNVQISAALGMSTYQVGRLLQQERKFQEAALRQGLMALNTTNAELRLGGRDFELIQEILTTTLK